MQQAQCSISPVFHIKCSKYNDPPFATIVNKEYSFKGNTTRPSGFLLILSCVFHKSLPAVTLHDERKQKRIYITREAWSELKDSLHSLLLLYIFHQGDSTAHTLYRWVMGRDNIFLILLAIELPSPVYTLPLIVCIGRCRILGFDYILIYQGSIYF